ncbi:MAG: alanine--tRNA ligase [Candidatus Woesearchaeota archaeon]|nr:MAG: alanine--tRNA ligase [Candidatus Woesearchaeota archaeon]
MLSDKEMKLKFKEISSKEPNKYYATKILSKEGFERKQCKKCKVFFWSTEKADVCGNASCSGGFRFIGNSPAKNKLEYIEVWKKFSKLFKKLGYTPIQRYPVVARWRKDTDFVQASIYDFQPHVVSGEVEPPANPLTVPQFCLRFNDIDNVGLTGAHYTGFVMIGQHAFTPPHEYLQENYFQHIHTWLNQGLGLKNEEITYHEDGWAGGGNVGPCMEFFSRGLELGNQVYITHEQTPSGLKELPLKILDMGMGHERNAWFSQGTSTSYETTFPTIVKMLLKETGLQIDSNLMKDFLPYSAYLNLDEAKDTKKIWIDISKELKVDVNDLRKKIIPLSALYSIAEHSRALLVAISDTALPSNVGGGYNLRIIYRRMLSFMEKYGWNIDLNKVTEEHAKYLKPLFPELRENLEDVKKILDVEKQKFQNTVTKTKQIIEGLINKEVTEEHLIQLYDSQGISPELIQEEAKKQNKKIQIPENFYAKVAELHEKKERQVEEKIEIKSKAQVKKPPETKVLYYEDPLVINFKAKVINIINDKYVILDQTAFYPESGGQEADTGVLGNVEVAHVKKQGNIIIHELKESPKFKEGDEIEGKINMIRRKQLSIHHTATHIINAAAKKILGNHINQAGAHKSFNKARIDITHYQVVSDEELKKIEEEANKIVQKKIKINRSWMSRNEAEKEYGMLIYQGGVVPGKTLRIVNIGGDIDVEACGGTHLSNTEEVGQIKLLRSSKISDSIVRIEFVAGEKALETEKIESDKLQEIADLLKVSKSQVPARTKELFELWKEVVKKGKKTEIKLTSTDEDLGSDAEILEKTASILKTQPENIGKTIKRFFRELEEKKL